MNSFFGLGLSKELLETLDELGYKEPTPIQKLAIPLALEGKDLLAAAQTGTGKTAAFMLPSIERMRGFATANPSPLRHPIRILVITPTRELADQIEENTANYLKRIPLRHGAVYGGVDMQNQNAALVKGLDVVVATVGRLKDHIGKKAANLSKVEILILDEADRMLDMGFVDDVREIAALTPKTRQTLMFSATFSEPIKKLAAELLRNPVEVTANRQNSAAKNVTQHVFATDVSKRVGLLRHIFGDFQSSRALVFCSTKSSVDYVARKLIESDLAADSIHGDRSQQQRLETLESFKAGKTRILVATDVAARGLDISDLDFVINFELPRQPEDYIHRIGRTGRNGASGVAISFLTAEETELLDNIRALTKQELPIKQIDGFQASWYRKPAFAAKAAPDALRANGRDADPGAPVNADGSNGRKRRSRRPLSGDAGMLSDPDDAAILAGAGPAKLAPAAQASFAEQASRPSDKESARQGDAAASGAVAPAQSDAGSGHDAPPRPAAAQDCARSRQSGRAESGTAERRSDESGLASAREPFRTAGEGANRSPAPSSGSARPQAANAAANIAREAAGKLDSESSRLEAARNLWADPAFRDKLEALSLNQIVSRRRRKRQPDCALLLPNFGVNPRNGETSFFDGLAEPKKTLYAIGAALDMAARSEPAQVAGSCAQDAGQCEARPDSIRKGRVAQRPARAAAAELGDSEADAGFGAAPSNGRDARPAPRRRRNGQDQGNN